MTLAADNLDLPKALLKQSIQDELADRGLTPAILRHFTIDLARKDGKLCLSFPSNFRTLKLNAAEEHAFAEAFNGWAESLANVKGEGTFAVRAEPASGRGLRDIECSAFNAFDLIRGMNCVLGTLNQVDSSLLGRTK